MMRNRFSVFNKSRLRERKRDVKASVRKCGIKTIEDVLNRLNMTYDDLKDNNKSIYLLEDQIIKY